MIIEILNALVHENFEVQEKMREVHGLELVLSNCIIDDNEPFIKERSIVCLRFLLLNNQKNQEFVSKLEAREAIPNETLDEAGFEVDIVDGKVKLKEKQKIKEVN
jgi:ataxin-10